MAGNEMVELNVAVIWALKKYGLVGLIDDVKSFAGTVSILYDHDYVHDCGVFTINCLAKYEEDIEESIHTWLENIEDDIEDNEEEKLSEYTGALLIPMPTNPWIVRSLNATAVKNLRESHKKLRMPDSVLKSQYSFVWEFPRPATRYTLDDFVTSQQLTDIADCVDTVETDLFGTEIYFGAENHQACIDFHEKLDVLMYGKLLLDPLATHVFYTEGYRPQPGKQITFDARFMSNVDYDLVRTTLFDVDGPKDVAFGYTFLANGITIRLCRWDAVTGFDVSFIGPKVMPRKGSVAQLHPVPYVPAKVVQHSNRLSHTLKIKDKHKPYAVAKLEQANVQNWMSNTELPEFELFPGLTTSMESRRDRVHENQAFADLEGLSFVSNGAPASVVSDMTEEQETIEPTRDKIVPVPIPVPVNTAVPPPMTGWGKQFAASKKKPIAPPRGHVTDGPVSRAPSPSVSSSSSRTGRHTGVKISNEIHAAVARLVLKGPYLRGKVTLRFDLGRIIIVGMDVSGLSFNMPSVRSNGWVKSKMVQNLKHADKSVLFSPILTQDGSDIEFMVKMTDLDMRQALWKKEATETKIYSFFCRYRYNGADDYFFIDIEAAKKSHPSAQTYIYSLRTENDDKRPIWIHGTMRSWDARIVMSYTDTFALEEQYGVFANHVVSSLPPLKDMATSMPRFHISSPPNMQILAMRVKTLWRFSSPGPDEASVLNVTEIRHVTHKVLACPREECNCTGAVYEFDLESTHNNTLASDQLESQDLGMWYEAFITSTAAEQALAKNEAVQLGEMAAWNYEHLKQEKAVEALIKPGLRMLQLMDPVGAHNDNHLMYTMKLPTPNHHLDGSTVPGANYLDEPRGSLSAVPENDTLEVDKFEQTAYPPLSIRGPVKMAAAPPNRVAPRREIASYRLSKKPTTDNFEKEVPKPVPQQPNRKASRSPSVEPARRPPTYQQQSSLRPQNQFW